MQVVVLQEPPRGVTVSINSLASSALTSNNVGSGIGVYKGLNGGTFEFKSLVQGNGIVLTNNTNDINISINDSYIQSLFSGSGITLSTPNRVVISNVTSNLDVSNVTSTELGYLSGSTSSIQNQLNGKQSTIIGAATTITSLNLSQDRAVISDSFGKISTSSITSTELSRLTGVTSNIQSQLNTLSSAITGFVTNPVSSDLIIPSAYNFEFGSNCILSSDSIVGSGGFFISLLNGGISTSLGTGSFGGGVRSGVDSRHFFYKTMTIPIGDWNMDTTASVNIFHGLDASRIRSVTAIIISDGGVYSIFESSLNLTSESSRSGYFGSLSGGNVTLVRVSSANGGLYDSTSYDQTTLSGSPYNRGLVTITYV